MEDYLSNLLDHIEGPNGPLKDSSKGIYLTRTLDIYNYLVDTGLIKRKSENLKFIEVHINAILEYLTNVSSFNTRKSYVTALLVILRSQDPTKFKVSLSILNDEMKKMKDHQDEMYKATPKTVSKGRGRPKKELEKPEENPKVDQIPKESWNPLVSRAKVAFDESSNDFERLVLALFVLQPPRNIKDYYELDLDNGYDSKRNVFIFEEGAVKINEKGFIRKYIKTRGKNRLFDDSLATLNRKVPEVLGKYLPLSETGDRYTIRDLRKMYSDEAITSTKKVQKDLGLSNKHGKVNWNGPR